ncbi:MAG: hypothetical protein L0220_14135 [Acidobacteria bacterium]|nr:hypothetical protein [Acidobacteriota bacterium]
MARRRSYPGKPLVKGKRFPRELECGCHYMVVNGWGGRYTDVYRKCPEHLRKEEERLANRTPRQKVVDRVVGALFGAFMLYGLLLGVGIIVAIILLALGII